MIEHRATCGYCHRSFAPKRRDTTTYCSRECAFALKRLIARERAWLRRHGVSATKREARSAKHPIRSCETCSRPYTAQTSMQRTCGRQECQRAMGQRDYKEKYWASVRETNPWVEKVCKCCGEAFRTNYMATQRQFCSAACRKRYHKELRRFRKTTGAAVEHITIEEIYHRDGGRCGICGKAVSLTLKCPHPQSATRDHIIPLARGGAHRKGNVQLAHFICNSTKGATRGYQLKLFA